MGDHNRFDKMKELRGELRPELRKFYALNPDNQYSALYTLLTGRIDELKLTRAFFTHLMALYIAEEKKQNASLNYFFKIQLPLIMEIVISIHYYDNQVYDEKGGITDQRSRKDNIIFSHLLKDQLYEYIHKYTEDAKDLIDCLGTIFKYVDIGQHMEEYCNRYENWQSDDEALNYQFNKAINEFVDEECIQIALELTKQCLYNLSLEKTTFLKLYFQRIYLTSGVLFVQITDYLCKRFDLNPVTHLQLRQFAGLYGMLLQIVNDNSDFVPSKYRFDSPTKKREDTFTDLSNSSITLPTFIHLIKCPTGTIKKYLEKGNKRISKAKEIKFFKKITKNHSVYYSMTIGKQMKNKANDLLNAENTNSPFFKDMCEIAENNKFYRHFYDQRKSYKIYKQSKKQCCV